MSRHRTPEEALQEAVMQYLDACLPPDAVAWHTPNGRQVSAITRKIGKAMGVKAGIPDVLILFRGKLIALELKAGRGDETAEQQLMARELTYCGAVVGPVCRSLDEVVAFVGQILPLRGRLSA